MITVSPRFSKSAKFGRFPIFLYIPRGTFEGKKTVDADAVFFQLCSKNGVLTHICRCIFKKQYHAIWHFYHFL